MTSTFTYLAPPPLVLVGVLNDLLNVGLVGDNISMLSFVTLDDNDSVLHDVGVQGGVKLVAWPLFPVALICSLRFFLASLSFSSVI